MKILNVEKSPVKNKRYRVTLDNGKHYDFGLLGGSTYLDHKDKTKKDNYWARHYGNPIEKNLIDHLIPSPALFSAYLLWGEHTDLDKNISDLNKKIKEQN